MIYTGKKDFRYLLAILTLTCVMSVAHAATTMVTLTNVMDGNGSSKFFDPSATSQSGTLGETIDIGLGTGSDAFLANGASIVNFATDTLFMTVTAPTGYTITSIEYSETGTGTVDDGFAAATGSMVVDGTPVNFLTQIFGSGVGTSGWSILPAPVAIANKESIDFSVTNSLVAFLFGTGSATIEKTGAQLTVGLTAIPIPPAIWMMGAAVAALISVGRRQSA